MDYSKIYLDKFSSLSAYESRYSLDVHEVRRWLCGFLVPTPTVLQLSPHLRGDGVVVVDLR
jgi:hypothetical protein